MAELVSYLSIEPHMRTFDVFTATLSPAHAGLFLRPARFPARALLPYPELASYTYRGRRLSELRLKRTK